MKAGNYQIRWLYLQPTTICSIVSSENVIIAQGRAYCNKKDNFCKDTGRKVSLAGALRDAQLSKDERRVVWELYRNMSPKKRW